MTLEGQTLNWYNNLIQHSIFSFEQLEDKFLNYFAIKIRRRSSIMDLLNMSQHDDESIKYYVARWRTIELDLPYYLPHDEHNNIFNKSCNKKMSSILKVQQNKYFENVLSKAKHI